MLIEKFNRKQLWNGCILSTIAHAVMVVEYPYTSNEQSWDGINYNIQDSCGSRGTITFDEKYLVAVFQDTHNVNKINECIEKGSLHIINSNNNLVENIANEEALQYVLDDVNGKTVPVITTGFWGVDNQIFAKENYEIIENDGAHLISKKIFDYNRVLQELIDEYEMNEIQVKLTELIYADKMRNPNDRIYLSETEKNILNELYGDDIFECEKTLNEINIYF